MRWKGNQRTIMKKNLVANWMGEWMEGREQSKSQTLLNFHVFINRVDCILLIISKTKINNQKPTKNLL